MLFVFLLSTLATVSYKLGSFERIELPARHPDFEKDLNKFWVDHDAIALAESYGLKGSAAFIVQGRTLVRRSIIAFPNGFVQDRGSREENLETIREIKRGVDLARGKQ